MFCFLTELNWILINYVDLRVTLLTTTNEHFKTSKTICQDLKCQAQVLASLAKMSINNSESVVNSLRK